MGFQVLLDEHLAILLAAQIGEDGEQLVTPFRLLVDQLRKVREVFFLLFGSMQRQVGPLKGFPDKSTRCHKKRIYGDEPKRIATALPIPLSAPVMMA